MSTWVRGSLTGLLLGFLLACHHSAVAHSDGGTCKPTAQGLPGVSITTVIAFNGNAEKHTGYYTSVGVAADGRNLYAILWSLGVFPDVVSAPVGGGGPVTTLFHGINVPPYALELFGPITDGTNVYWYGTQGVWQVPVGGGSATRLQNDTNSGGIAVDAHDVYWTNYLNINRPTTTSGVIVRMPIGGGAATTLFAGPAYPQHIAVDSHNVYWTAYNYFNKDTKTAAVLQLSLQGGTAVTLAQGLDRAPTNLAVGTHSVYWSDADRKAIRKVPIDGGDITTMVSSAEGLGGFAARDGQFYWSESDCGLGFVARMPEEGGETTVLATGVGDDLALDDTSIYLSGGGGLARITPR